MSHVMLAIVLGVVTVWATTVPVQAASPTRPEIVDALLAGRDTSAEAARVRAGGRAVNKDANRERTSALFRFRNDADALRMQLTGKTTADGDALQQSLERLEATVLLVEAEFDHIEKQPMTVSDGDFLRARVLQARARWNAHIDPLLSAIRAAVRAPGDAKLREEALRALTVATAQPAQRTFGAVTLPVHRSRLSPRAPLLQPNVTPSYATASFVQALPEDLDGNLDTPLTVAVREQAARLNHDYTAIFDYVRTQIRTEWRSGAAQHVDETLRRGAGNDVEQASLLIALLRASRAPSRYVTGVVELPVADLSTQIGVPENQVGAALAASGIAHAPVVSGGHISGFRIEHVWVSALVPFGNYRGSVADTDDPTWIPLMPALKPATFEVGTPLASVLPLGVSEFIGEYLSSSQAGLPWDVLRQRLTAALAAQQPPRTLTDLVGFHAVDAAPLGILPASTPYPVVAVNLELHELLDEQRQWLTVRLRDGEAESGPVLLEQRLALSHAPSHRIALSYLPATVEDQHLTNRRGGLGGFPYYLVRLRPTLTVGGRPMGAGKAIVEAGQPNRLELLITAPGGELAVVQTLLAGTLAVADLDSSGNPVTDAEPEVADSDLVATRLLGSFARRYLQEWGRADSDSAEAIGVRLLRPLPSVVLALPQYRVDGSFGLVERFHFDGVALDAAARPVEPISLHSSTEDEADWLRLSALGGSALESRLYEQLWAVDALSADRALQLASERGTPVLNLVPGSGTGELAAHSASVREQIGSWLSRGYFVDIASDPLTEGTWTGSAWRVHSDLGEAGYFLSGTYAGGVTVIPPGLWYFQDLAQALADPYAPEPNDDPLAGFLVQIDSEAQYQVVTAGEWAPSPLQAYVTDKNGLPVVGASVTFGVRQGGAKLRAVSDEGALLTVLTDHRGVAQVDLRAPESGAGLDGGFIRLDGDVNYRNAYATTIDLVVDTREGPLTPGEPYVSYMVAGEAVRIAIEPRLGSGLVTVPGLGFEGYRVHAYDAWDNEVSNVPVNFSVSDSYVGPGCEGNFDLPGSGVFLPEQCPSKLVSYAGLSCAGSQTDGLTNFRGLDVNVAPSSVYSTRITLVATSPAGEQTWVLNTVLNLPIYSDPDTGIVYCDAPTLGSIQQWIIGETYDIGRLGERLPYPRRLQFAMTEGGRETAGVEWYPVDPLNASVVVNGGSASPMRVMGVGEREYDLLAGGAPARLTGQINAVLPDHPHDFPISGNLSPAWALDLPMPAMEPDSIELDAFQRTTHAIRLTAPILPTQYVSSGITLEIVDQDGTMQSGCYVADAPAGASCILERGVRFEPDHTYFARYIVNPTSAYAATSDSAPVDLGRRVIAGFGGYDSSEPPPDLDTFVARKYPRLIELQTEVDTQTGYLCKDATQLVYAVGMPATIDINFYSLDEDGERDQVVWHPVDAEERAEGVYTLGLSLDDLDFGVYEIEIRASAGSTEEEHIGRLVHRERRRGSLPLSHPFVKGVDLYDGHAVVSVEDAMIDGRGPGLRFTRTYASHSGDDRTALGRGWSSDLDSQVLHDSCGTHTVVGGAGQGQRYFLSGVDAEGNSHFQPMNGFHGTLVGLVAGGFDFYAKDGTRYHYAEPGLGGPHLSYIEDTNGNRVTYEYGRKGGEWLVLRIVDDAGRSLNLRYETLAWVRPMGNGLDIHETRLLLTGLDGPAGLSVNYSYDDQGNLVEVVRGGSGGGQHVDAYAYENLGGMWMQDPDSNFRYYHFGFRLVEARNAVDGSQRSYTYGVGWIGVPYGGGRTLLIPEQRAVSLVEPDGGGTGFIYSGLRGMAGTSTVVSDPRNASSSYTMNVWGGAEQVVTPAGTTTTSWNLTHLQPDSVVDPLGTTTTYTYDEHGNRTQENIQHAHGNQTRSWTYAPPEAFAVPIKNRVLNATDARGITTQHSYDSRGNLLGKSRGGITEEYAYAASGDRIRATNGAGESVLYEHDAYGYVRREEDGEGVRRSAGWDALGRLLWEADGTGARTDYAYDGLDRRILTTLPPEGGAGAGGTRAERQIIYNDASRVRTDVDERGNTTVTTHDTMGRPVSIRNAMGDTRSMAYDYNGNLTSETDFRGNQTTHQYDSANRRTRTNAPLGKVTLYSDHDALGNVLAESTSGPDGSTRRTQYEYRHPQNLRTHVRQAIDSTTWTETVTAYDGNGNVVAVMDPNGNLETRSYDDRDRLIHVESPEDRVVELAYDQADRKNSETLSGPGLDDPQVRTWTYDGRGRETTRIDAQGKVWRTGYDAADRPISRSNPLGATWRSTYDPRGRIVQETGPVEEQINIYGYDAAGNRTLEETPDGRVLEHAYDELNRRISSLDQLGPVESLTYDPDGNVLTRKDAEDRLTTSAWDALNHETSRTLPQAQGQTRRLEWTYNVHGDVLTETDANGNTTTHTYDDLGRRTSTLLPVVSP